MANVCIIPARGGSKRIPRKNIRDFLGKPIIAYSIQAAIDSKLFDEVMVSTDDDEIASISKSYGASNPFFRSQKNSDDTASTMDVLEEVIHDYQQLGRKFEFGCCIYPTAPFVKPEMLKKAYQIMLDEKYDTVFPIVKFGYPIWRAFHQINNKVEMVWPENETKRSQDLPTAFHDAGQWYWFNTTKAISGKKILTKNTFGLEVSELEVQDIDNESDWKIAEMKYRMI